MLPEADGKLWEHPYPLGSSPCRLGGPHVSRDHLETHDHRLQNLTRDIGVPPGAPWVRTDKRTHPKADQAVFYGHLCAHHSMSVHMKIWMCIVCMPRVYV